MTLSELSVRMSHREFQGWCTWLDKKWNEPDRTDHYLMQIASFIEARGLRRQPKKLNSQKLSFERSVVKQKARQPSTTARWSAVLKRQARGNRGRS